jgi:branched-chain amino acid aminotransferase
MSFCYFKDKFIPVVEAGVSLNDLLIQRGYGIFDFLRVQNGRPLFLEDHLDRFFNSASVMHMNLKQNRDEMRSIVKELVEKNNIPNSGLKMMIAGGESPDGYAVVSPHLIMLQIPIASPPSESMSEKGFHLCSREYQRQFPEVKTVDYLMDIWLNPWLKQQGGDDIVYHNNGLVRECPRANIFMVSKDDVLVTSGDKMLKGVTRKHILGIARELGITAQERDVTLQEFYDAKEVFVSSTTKRVLPVYRLDHVFRGYNYDYIRLHS